MGDVPIVGPRTNGTARLQDTTMEQSLGLLGDHHVMSRSTSCTFAENGDAVGISPETSAIILDPLEGQHLILEASVSRYI